MRNFASIALLAASTLAASSAVAGLDGDSLLAQAAAANGALRSYAVPVHFDVHMHKPIGLKIGVDGTNYFKAPGQDALVITKAPPVIGGFFKRSYDLDVAPQAWPAKYSVTSMTTAQRNGTPVFELRAVPKTPGDIDHVTIDITRDGYQPIAAQWTYRDRSTVSISIVNQQLSSYTLPRVESIAVAMPRYDFDATSHFGAYAFNVAVPDSVFVTK
jgi:hypothetical protein